MAVLGEEIVEPPRFPVFRCDERCIGRPVARGRSRLSGGMLLDDRAAPVIDRKALQPLAEPFRHRRDLRQQRHHVIADKAGNCPV